MSLNLHCKEIDLWQTPTYITLICFSNNDGGWRGIKYRYETWVKSRLNGVWENEIEYENLKTSIKGHIKELNSFKKLNFYIM